MLKQVLMMLGLKGTRASLYRPEPTRRTTETKEWLVCRLRILKVFGMYAQGWLMGLWFVKDARLSSRCLQEGGGSNNNERKTIFNPNFGG